MTLAFTEAFVTSFFNVPEKFSKIPFHEGHPVVPFHLFS